METKEVLDGLNDLVEDRRSFFHKEPDDFDAVFRRDEEVLLAAINYIRKREVIEMLFEKTIKEMQSNNTKVRVFLMGGFQYQGHIKECDASMILLRNGQGDQIIPVAAISTISPIAREEGREDAHSPKDRG